MNELVRGGVAIWVALLGALWTTQVQAEVGPGQEQAPEAAASTAEPARPSSNADDSTAEDTSPEGSEPRLGHQVSAGLTGVYDGGDDRGLHYGLGYQLSYSALRVSALLSMGDTDPRREQHWALKVGARIWRSLRFDFGFHHRTFSSVGFGENLLTFTFQLNWRGLEVSAGWILRFPIIDRDRIHSPFVFDRELFEHFIGFRLGYVWQIDRGFGLGFLIGTFSRYEIHNLDYPQFALVMTYEHPRIGRFRLDGGIGTAGFFNMGSTIDRGFLRLEYVYER